MYAVLHALLVFCILNTLLAKGELGLKITKTENGVTTSAQSPLQVFRSANFTLSCTLMDTQTRNLINNPKIVWSKAKSSKLMNVRGLNVAKQTNLTFTQTALVDGGAYFCRRLGYNITKLVHIVVVNRTFSAARSRPKSKRYIDHHSDDLLTTSRDNDPKTQSNRNFDFTLEKNKNWNPRDGVNEETHANSIATHHNGVPHNVLIGLGVGFLIAFLLGLYHIFKCWRSGTLSIFRVGSHKPNRNILSVPTPNFGGND